MSEDGLSKWEEQHAGALGASEVRTCLHCAAKRILGEPKTKPFTAQQKKRMSIGKVFEAREREILRLDGTKYWRPNKPMVLEGYAVPIMLTPDILIKGDDGDWVEIREVKYRTFPPATLPLLWATQMGVYQMHSALEGRIGTWGVHTLDDRMEFRQEQPSSDLQAVLVDWTEALREVKEGRLKPTDLPHEPAFCKHSEWACDDCIGAREAMTELSTLEERRIADYLRLHEEHEGRREGEKEHDAASDAVKEILAAHGGFVLRDGLRLVLKQTKPRETLNRKLIPPEILAAATEPGKPARSIIIEKE